MWGYGGKMSRRDEPKPWMCRGGHILGLVVRTGGGGRQLLLYREAVDPQGQEEMGEVDVIALVSGLVMDVRCSRCGRIRTWVPLD